MSEDEYEEIKVEGRRVDEIRENDVDIKKSNCEEEG